MTTRERNAAKISLCGRYRYELSRQWAAGACLSFIMLNPSTADADLDDPTIRRCIGFAKREGAGGLVVGNVYALRSTNPKALLTAVDPIGPDNAVTLTRIAADSIAHGLPVVCAWGIPGGYGALRALPLLAKSGARLVCLGKTKNGSPRHPLYIKSNQPLEPFP